MRKVVVSQVEVTLSGPEIASWAGLEESEQWKVSPPAAGDEPNSVVIQGPVVRNDA